MAGVSIFANARTVNAANAERRASPSRFPHAPGAPSSTSSEAAYASYQASSISSTSSSVPKIVRETIWIG